MSETQLMEHLGGRKFVLALLSMVSASVLVWFGRITPEVYGTVMLAVAGAYSAANVLQKVFAK